MKPVNQTLLIEPGADFPAPVVSVVVTSYNYGKYLVEALRSLQRQNFNDWECIVVDDGSTDNSRDLFSGSTLVEDKRIRYVYQENQGLSAARNRGLELARGVYIQFLDADDMFLKDKLRTHVDILERERDIDVVYGQYVCVFGEDICTFHPKHKNSLTMSQHPFRDFLRRWEKGLSIPIHCYLFRRECFRWGTFDPELPTHEDLDLALRFSANGARYRMTDSEEVVYRIHQGSMARDFTRMHKGYLLTLLKALRNPAASRYRLSITHRYCQEYFNTAFNWIRGKNVKFRESIGNPGAGTLNAVACLLLPLYLILKIESKLDGRHPK